MTAHHEKASFLSALPTLGLPLLETVDMESYPEGAIVSPGDPLGSAAVFPITIEPARVTSAFSQPTPGGVQSLGAESPDDSFRSGDSLSLSFPRKVAAIGLYVIGSPGDVRAGDLTLVTAAGSVSNRATPDLVLPDGGEAFFLGLVLTPPHEGITEALLLSIDPTGDGLFVFNLDDFIFQPELLDYEQWAARSFPPGTPEIEMDPLANPDGDTLVNLLEYYTCHHPLVHDPDPFSISVAGGDLFFDFPRSQLVPPGAGGFEGCDDLQSWIDIAPAEVVLLESLGDVWYLRAIFPTSGVRYFVRLKVN